MALKMSRGALIPRRAPRPRGPRPHRGTPGGIGGAGRWRLATPHAQPVICRAIKYGRRCKCRDRRGGARPARTSKPQQSGAWTNRAGQGGAGRGGAGRGGAGRGGAGQGGHEAQRLSRSTSYRAAETDSGGRDCRNQSTGPGAAKPGANRAPTRPSESDNTDGGGASHITPTHPGNKGLSL